MGGTSQAGNDGLQFVERNYRTRRALISQSYAVDVASAALKHTAAAWMDDDDAAQWLRSRTEHIKSADQYNCGSCPGDEPTNQYSYVLRDDRWTAEQDIEAIRNLEPVLAAMFAALRPDAMDDVEDAGDPPTTEAIA